MTRTQIDEDCMEVLKVTCRCGKLDFTRVPPDRRVECPECGSSISPAQTEHWLQRQVRQSTDRLAGYEKGEAAIRKALWLEAAEMAEARAAHHAEQVRQFGANTIQNAAGRRSEALELAAAYRAKAERE